MKAAEVKYKKTGDKWIPEIPELWDLRRLKYFAKIGSGQDQRGIENDNGKYSIYGTGGLMGKTNDCLYEGPSVILGRKGTIDNPFYVTEPFWTVDTAYYTKININVDSRFFFYCCLTIQFDYYKYGSAVPSMSQRDLNQIRLPFPPLNEQNAIANYLDQQCLKINHFIQTKQRFIELLKEQRQSIITNAVTRGIDGNVKMKSSGFYWIGAVPEHWEIRSIKNLLALEKGAIKAGPFGSDLKGTDIIDKGFKIYNQRTVLDNDFTQGTDYISKSKFNDLSVFEVKEGDILLTTRGTIGKASIVPCEFEKGIIHPCLIRLRVDKTIVKNEFVSLIFNEAKYFFELIKMESNSNTIDVIYADTLKFMKLLIPPIKEQERIIDHINTETRTIDIAINKAEREIELIKEYRASMIAEAVTGKMNVLSSECRDNDYVGYAESRKTTV